LRSGKTSHSLEYLGTSIPKYHKYLEDLFEEGMTWGNYGEWHIDHIIPIDYREGDQKPTQEEVAKRLHYTNTQPMWAANNRAKSNKRIGK
jgi:hypothetical protein